MEQIRGKRGISTRLWAVAPYLAGVAVVYPASVFAAGLLLPGIEARDGGHAGARTLFASWQFAFFLAAVLLPLFLNRTAHNNFSRAAAYSGLLRFAGFAAVSFVCSLLLSPSLEPRAVLNAVNLHIFLFSFAFLLSSVFYLCEGAGAGGNASQLAATSIGLAMVGTVLYFNPLIEGELVSETFRETSIRACIGLNPVIVALHNFVGVDFFHQAGVYEFSSASSFRYEYPSWQGAAGMYVLAGSGLLMTGILAHFLRVVLPQNLLQHEIRLSRESRRTRISAWQAGEAEEIPAARLIAPAVHADDAPGPAQGPSILESLFGSMEKKLQKSGGKPDAASGADAQAAPGDLDIDGIALDLGAGSAQGDSWEEKAPLKAPDTPPGIDMEPWEGAAPQAPDATAAGAAGESPGPVPAAAEPGPAADTRAEEPPLPAGPAESDSDDFEEAPRPLLLPPEPEAAPGTEPSPPESEGLVQDDLAKALAEFDLKPAPAAADGDTVAPEPPVSGDPADRDSASKEVKTGLLGNLVKGLGDLDTRKENRETGQQPPVTDLKTGLLGTMLRQMDAEEAGETAEDSGDSGKAGPEDEEETEKGGEKGKA